jgi:cytosine/adenosine deaminase-related metal-dependent hydrolase
MDSYLSAPWVYPVTTLPLENGVIAVSKEGTITGIYTAQEAADLQITNITTYQGILVPGLVNTHCHLELSHLKGKIDTHTGLPGFVQQVIQQRGVDADEIDTAMLAADAEMFENGIVAVGDISNQIVSRSVKQRSKIYYHTFVEAMGFNPVRVAQIIEHAQQVKDAFAPLIATVVPHAPYSVSAELFQKIMETSGAKNDIVSIHNQETPDENAFFEYKTGHFLKLYEFLGLDITFFEAQGKTSLQTYLPLLSPLAKTLLVHNTFTSKADLDFAAALHSRLYWCLCPNANLYIENKLPDISLFKAAGIKMTLGTDSLASNHQLSILDEMRVLQEQKGVAFDELLLWATLNGAEFLSKDSEFGSFEKGKKPGINLIEMMDDGVITTDTRVRRLV